MCKVDVHRTLSTATFAERMCTRLSPQKQLHSRCAQNHSHSNMSRVNVAVAKVLCTSALHMLLWLRLCQHRLCTCCCGYGSVHVGSADVAVAKVLYTSAVRMLLWLTFGNVVQSKQCSGHPKQNTVNLNKKTIVNISNT